MNTAPENDPRPGLSAKVKRAGLMKNSPTATKTTKGTSLLIVNTLPKRMDWRTPIILMSVIQNTSAVMITTLVTPDSAAGQK